MSDYMSSCNLKNMGHMPEEKRPNNTINHDIVNLARNYPSKVGDDE